MQGGMKKQWDEYYALYIVTWIQSESMLRVKYMRVSACMVCTIDECVFLPSFNV